MNLRKIFLPLLLSLVLLGSQHMGWAHALSHLGDGKSSASQTKQLPPDSACEQCLAFAQLGSALGRAPLTFVAVPLAARVALEHLVRSAPALTHCVFQSRGPPSYL